MELNRELTRYSTDAEEQAAYEGMQKAALKIAERLMEMPQGTLANVDGCLLWVTPIKGKYEVVCSFDYSESAKPGDCTVFMVSSFEGQSADDLNTFKNKLTLWLREPNHKMVKDPSHPHAVAEFWHSSK